jgi:hypothetical protein
MNMFRQSEVLNSQPIDVLKKFVASRLKLPHGEVDSAVKEPQSKKNKIIAISEDVARRMEAANVYFLDSANTQAIVSHMEQNGWDEWEAGAMKPMYTRENLHDMTKPDDQLFGKLVTKIRKSKYGDFRYYMEEWQKCPLESKGFLHGSNSVPFKIAGLELQDPNVPKKFYALLYGPEGTVAEGFCFAVTKKRFEKLVETKLKKLKREEENKEAIIVKLKVSKAALAAPPKQLAEEEPLLHDAPLADAPTPADELQLPLCVAYKHWQDYEWRDQTKPWEPGKLYRFMYYQEEKLGVYVQGGGEDRYVWCMGIEKDGKNNKFNLLRSEVCPAGPPKGKFQKFMPDDGNQILDVYGNNLLEFCGNKPAGKEQISALVTNYYTMMCQGIFDYSSFSMVDASKGELQAVVRGFGGKISCTFHEVMVQCEKLLIEQSTMFTLRFLRLLRLMAGAPDYCMTPIGHLAFTYAKKLFRSIDTEPKLNYSVEFADVYKFVNYQYGEPDELPVKQEPKPINTDYEFDFTSCQKYEEVLTKAEESGHFQFYREVFGDAASWTVPKGTPKKRMFPSIEGIVPFQMQTVPGQVAFDMVVIRFRQKDKEPRCATPAMVLSLFCKLRTVETTNFCLAIPVGSIGKEKKYLPVFPVGPGPNIVKDGVFIDALVRQPTMYKGDPRCFFPIVSSSGHCLTGAV